MIGQRVRRSGAEDAGKTLDRRILHLHPRGPVGARPHHRASLRHIAGLDAARDLRAIRGAAESGPGKTAETGQRQRGSGADQQMTPGQTKLAASRNRHRKHPRRIAAEGARSI